MVKAVKAAQLADPLRDYLAQWSAQDLFGLFFSLTQVTLEPDMQSAVVWVDVLQPDQAAKVMRELSRHLPDYQRRLQRSLQRRNVPRISFKLDDRESLSARMDELLNGD